MSYYSAIRKDEILPFVTTWINLENIMLSEISSLEKAKREGVGGWQRVKTVRSMVMEDELTLDGGHTIHRSRIMELYTRSLYDPINQCNPMNVIKIKLANYQNRIVREKMGYLKMFTQIYK